MRNISDKSCRENKNTRVAFRNFFLENLAFYEITWKEPGRLQMTIWRTRVACWIPKSTNTHSENVIFIAFQLQQWLQDRASLLRSALPLLLFVFWASCNLSRACARIAS